MQDIFVLLQAVQVHEQFAMVVFLGRRGAGLGAARNAWIFHPPSQAPGNLGPLQNICGGNRRAAGAGAVVFDVNVLFL